MNESSDVVSKLEARVGVLEAQFRSLHERLRTFGTLLGGAESTSARSVTASPTPAVARQRTEHNGKRKESTPRAKSTRRPSRRQVSSRAAGESPASGKAPRPGPKDALQDAQAGGTTKWFEGDPFALFRKILQWPMPTRESMTPVVEAKRKSQLPKQSGKTS